MILREYKKGDRVVANPEHFGRERKGTVRYASGAQYWVLFDGDKEITPSVHSWWLEPLVEREKEEALAA